MKKLIIAGGGTGGHVLAGIAIADEWKQLHGARAEILFVGAQGGLEEKLVPKHGYTLKLLKLGALNRVSWQKRIQTLLQIPVTLFQSFMILLQFKPNYVVGVGGYASGPVVLMAATVGRLLGIRSAVLEQNSVAGLTNKILGKFVDRIFVALPSPKLPFAFDKIKVTGNPVRSQMKPMSAPQFRPFTLFIFGGSQGALGMNTLVIQALPFLKGHDIKFIHQTGVKDYERVKKAYEDLKIPARVEKFIDQMDVCYQQASLIICRAGSSTMAEIAAVGRAAIFVPLPEAADNHQEWNARIFADSQAAWISSQRLDNGEKLAFRILDLKEQPQKILDAMQSVSKFYKPNAARDLVHFL